MRRLKAPAANGEVLAEPGFDAIPALVEANRKLLDRDDIRIDGISLRELRALARREVFDDSNDSPLLLAGHQPELSHPGVWIKNFALNGLARKLGGIPLHLVVDCDSIKSTSVKLPTFHDRDPTSVHLATVPYDVPRGKPTFEEYAIQSRDSFDAFLPTVAELTRNWGLRPLVLDAWQAVDPSARLVGEQLAELRQRYEREWGCRNRELPVSVLSRTQAFRHFTRHIIGDLSRFRDAYNAAIRSYRQSNRIRSHSHPAPELDPGELPFWEQSHEGRRKPGVDFDPTQLRPRALTLTLFARLCLGDFFIHGIGGGKYDEVTDAIIRDYLGIEPPAYQVLSATLHLPLPGFASSQADVERAASLVRDLHWNPQRHVVPPSFDDPRMIRLVADRIAMASNEPSFKDLPGRRAWFGRLRDLNERLRPYVWKQVPPATAASIVARTEARANAVLQRRDFAWVLYPETTLRPFLQRFLDV